MKIIPHLNFLLAFLQKLHFFPISIVFIFKYKYQIMKNIVLSESELISMIKSITNKLNEDDMMSDVSSDPERRVLDPREREVKNVFGKYRQHIPSDVLRYLRKNPQNLFKQLYKIYGEDAYKYLDNARQD